MTSPLRTKRAAVLLLALLSGLVCSGFVWATSVVMERERDRAGRASKLAFEESRQLALNRLDGFLAPIIGRESARPYNHFRARYKPTEAWSESDNADLSGAIVLPSPLAEKPEPRWILLHFQAFENESGAVWTSPQLDASAAYATPAGAFPADDRAERAAPENWLAGLRDRYTPLLLQAELESAVASRIERRRNLRATRAEHDEPIPTGVAPPLRAGPRASSDDPSRSAAEFARRGEQILELELEHNVDQCVPERIAIANLEAAATLNLRTSDHANCVSIWITSMTPVWLDLTLDGGQQLAFVRSVVVQGSESCTLQGFLIDWDRLKSLLQDEVRDLFPQVQLRTVPVTAPLQPNMLHTLPVVLETGSTTSAVVSLSMGLKLGLGLAWGTCLLALVAIIYGVLRHLALTERRMKFVTAVTHELRTPLTSFQLYTDLLAEAPDATPEKQRRYVQTLRQESQRLARLVENVFAYARIGDARPTLHRRSVRLSALLESIRASTSETCHSAGKRLVIEIACPTDLSLNTDPELVTQILVNLIENACKYAGESPSPDIHLHAALQPDARIAFEVDDAGDGVPHHLRSAVFEPFDRGIADAPGSPGGMGLGLALSRFWAECLGGTLTLRKSARPPGHWSCFILQVPSLPADQHAGAEGNSRGTPAPNLR